MTSDPSKLSTRQRIGKEIQKIKAKALDTTYPKWIRVLGAFVFGLMCTSVVFTSVYLVYSIEEMQCHLGIMLMTIPWLLAELFIIWFLYKTDVVPRYIRESISILICLSNVWFGFFIFGLTACQ